ncbi:transcriptional regulator GutM [Pseudalkalibacillus caeni]|uniref:Transcriptional regulator n=1 Tax=Exobacillus caeni TaxID=2574798 RepID=A0A5R9FBW2_9BACL|nr:transcriptional regulator GutM [Pseudalkalibacillus caeni]TLS38373.1 transcriptional regulator [Pseudalkalibacillus caeni]
MKFAFILSAVLIVQFLLSLLQIRYYRKSMDKIVSDYKNKEGYYMFSGMDRRKFRPGAIAVIIVDQNYVVRECHTLGGLSVLSKFKQVEEYQGIHVGELLNRVHVTDDSKKGKKKKVPAMNAALTMASENALLSVSKKNMTTA